MFKISLVAGAASYGLIAFWYNLGFIGSFFQEGGGIARNYVSLFPWGYFLFFWIALGLYFFFNKIVRKSSIAVSLLWFLFCFGVVYVYYISAPSSLSEQRIEFVPQALRLMTEADMALALLIGVLTATLTDWLGKKKLAGKIAGFSVELMIMAGLLMYGYSYLPYAQKALSQEIDLTQTSEYEVAQWLEQHVDKSKGERVYTAGNTGFYLNYFTDIWQLRGGLYQAKTHPWPEHIYYQMTNGKDSQIAEAWLKIANIRYLVVNTNASRELYKEFKHPEKFIGLKKVYENRGDIIYELPLADCGPAKVIKLDFVSGYQPPIKADDKKPLLAYADWLARAKPADFQVINNDTYIIKANQETGEGILVQMTYDSGFRAKSDRGKVSLRSDPMGFLILVSSASGEQTITLSHRPKISAYFGYLLTLVTVGGLIVWLVFYRKRPVG